MRSLAIRVYPILFAASASALAMDAHVVVRQFPAPNASGAVRMGGTSDGEIWFAQPNADSLARIEPDGSVNEWPVPVAESRPQAVARTDFGGRLAFTLLDTNRIGLMDADGDVTEYAIPTPDSEPRGIAVSSLVWFTEYDGNRIGRLDPGAPVPIQEFPLPTLNAGPLGIAPGPGAIGGTTDLWFTEYLANKIGRINAAGVITEYSIPTANSGPTAIVAGVVDGQDVMFFTEATAGKIGRITSAGHITEYRIPTSTSAPNDIVYDEIEEGLWFTEPATGKIGFMSVDGDFREFDLPGGTRPDGIALGRRENSYEPRAVWFVDGVRRRVGRLADNFIVAIGAGHGLTWDTVFEVSNLAGEPAQGRLSVPIVGVCPTICPNNVEFHIPRDDTAEVAASDVPGSDGEHVFLLDTLHPEINDVPETRAWIVDADRPELRIDLPLVDYWAVAAMLPPLPSGSNGPRPFLQFPARRTTGVRTDLLLAALATDGSNTLSVLIEALDADGDIVAEMPLELPVMQLVVLDKILTELEIFGDFEGHLRVKRVSRSGFFWGAAEILEGGRLTRVMAPGSELDPARCPADQPRCATRPQPRVVPRSSSSAPTPKMDDPGFTNTLFAVGAGKIGTWDTDFEVSSVDGVPTSVLIGRYFPSTVCTLGCVHPAILVETPEGVVAGGTAGEVPYLRDPGVDTFVISGCCEQGASLPRATARIVNRVRPEQAAEIPLVDLGTLAATQPPTLARGRNEPRVTLTFPVRREAGRHTNLVVANLRGDSIFLRIELVRSDGIVLRAFVRRGPMGYGETGFFADVLGKGVEPGFEGSLRITRHSSEGFFWATLAHVYADGRLELLAPTPGLH